MSSKYEPAKFESKWVEEWEKSKVYEAESVSKDKPHFAQPPPRLGQTSKASRGKVYVLSMFPYPSGSGLHVGHVRIYTGTDILARYFRMKGYSVLHPMGWDAFGLPAENAAIKAKKNPMDMVPQNIANFKQQMQRLGLSYDWQREFATTDPDYYKWTQWLFLQLYSIKNKKGERLVYRAHAPIRWCPQCKTGLANEEVLPDGTHERCGTMTEEKLLPQWMMRITDYAERLLSDLSGLDWPRGILEMQKNWIGKKKGIVIKYQVSSIKYQIECFTTRPDTNFGATFIVLAPEHPFVKKIKDTKVQAYVTEAKSKTKEERMKEGRKKTGVFTRFYAINNLNGKKMPIWVSDFVLADFGTGAVVGVPGHDKRDFEFAREFSIEIIRVVVGSDGDKSPITRQEQVQEQEGTMINSDFLNDLDIHVATQKIIDYFVEKGWGKRHVTYHLRDWIFSRQRYWGEPFPLVYCDKCGDENGVVPVPEEQLPVVLPYVKSYEPTETGESPLSKIEDWVKVPCPECGGPARRETDTMPNWAGSCWYFLYFARSRSVIPSESPDESRDLNNNLLDEISHPTGVEIRNDNPTFPNIENWKLLVLPKRSEGGKIGNSNDSWLPVDWYLGGAEHAVLHLLYARFWVKAFNDLGLVGFTEPFIKLRNVGMVLATDNKKMSKSLGNVVNPDDVISEYGADTLRVYEAFMAPFSQEVAWSTSAVQGSYRFLSRIWHMYTSYDRITNDAKEEDEELVVKLQRVISKISSDITDVKYNTSIAAMMSFLNEWEVSAGPPPSSSPAPSVIPSEVEGSHTNQGRKLSKANAKVFLQLLAPFAPFIAEELWHTSLGEKESIHLSKWPEADTSALKNQTTSLAIQVNGKVRSVISVSSEASQEDAVKLALKDEKVIKYISNQKYKVIYVAGRILNFVI